MVSHFALKKIMNFESLDLNVRFYWKNRSGFVDKKTSSQKELNST